MNSVGIAEYDRPIPERDHWLRRRIRMCDWKPWRTCRTNVRNLLKLGVPFKAAMSVGMSRKRVWRMSKTSATQRGMTNQWLKEQGVMSITDLWVHMHDPATARSHVETPLAVPHAGCCGEGRSKTVPYPIRLVPLIQIPLKIGIRIFGYPFDRSERLFLPSDHYSILDMLSCWMSHSCERFLFRAAPIS